MVCTGQEGVTDTEISIEPYLGRGSPHTRKQLHRARSPGAATSDQPKAQDLRFLGRAPLRATQALRGGMSGERPHEPDIVTRDACHGASGEKHDADKAQR